MRRLPFVLLALLALHCAHPPETPPARVEAPTPAPPTWPEAAPPALRLPDTVRPVRYALELTLLPEAPTYPGTVSIDVEVREPVRQVWLHGQDVEVSAARVEVAGRTIEAKLVTASEGRLGLLLPEALAPGQARHRAVLHGQGGAGEEPGPLRRDGGR